MGETGEHTDFALTYTAENRLIRVRFLMYLSLVFLGLMVWLSIPLTDMFSTGVEPNGDPISRGEVVALLAICQLAGWAFAVGMHLYGRCYVVRIFTSPDGAEQVYETVGWLGRIPWFIGKDEKESCRFHRGRSKGFYSASLDVTVMAVDAPYHAQRVRSRRLPFVIDGNGVFLGG